VAESKADEDVPDWPHNYLIIKGEFENGEEQEAFLPRIKLQFADDDVYSSTGPSVAVAVVASAVTPVEDALKEKILAMTLEIDEEPVTATDCYYLSEDRAELLSAVVDGGLTSTNGVAVTCTDEDGEVLETIVKVSEGGLEHCLFEDPIMATEASIASFVEAQFVEGGPWVLSRATLSGIEAERGTLFKLYEDSISNEQPDCLSTLRRMLQSGPITKLYTGGGGKYVSSHEGFSLRMPPAEVQEWQMVNDKGDTVDIPRPCFAVRTWNAESRSYDEVSATLVGAPIGEDSTDEWFIGVIKKLKSSNYLGSDLLDALVTSKKTVSMEALNTRDIPNAFEGEYSSRWSDLVLGTKI